MSVFQGGSNSAIVTDSLDSVIAAYNPQSKRSKQTLAVFNFMVTGEAIKRFAAWLTQLIDRKKMLEELLEAFKAQKTKSFKTNNDHFQHVKAVNPENVSKAQSLLTELKKTYAKLAKALETCSEWCGSLENLEKENSSLQGEYKQCQEKIKKINLIIKFESLAMKPVVSAPEPIVKADEDFIAVESSNVDPISSANNQLIVLTRKSEKISCELEEKVAATRIIKSKYNSELQLIMELLTVVSQQETKYFQLSGLKININQFKNGLPEVTFDAHNQNALAFRLNR